REAADGRAEAAAAEVRAKYKPKFDKLRAELPHLPTTRPEEPQGSWLNRMVKSVLGSGETIVLGPPPTAVQTRKAQQQHDRLRRARPIQDEVRAISSGIHYMT